MADTKISGLPAVTGLTGGELVPIDQSATNKRYTVGIPVRLQPANPTGRTNGAAVMMGLGTTCVYTPTSTGRLFVVMSGEVTLTTTGNPQYQGLYGTGTAPANQAVVSGTSFSRIKLNVIGGGSTASFPWAIQGVITGVALNVALWFDMSLGTGGGTGVANLYDIDFTCFEI